MEVSVAGLPAGAYLYRAYEKEGGVRCGKFVVNH